MIQVPKSYANLAECMIYENQLLIDEGMGPESLPHDTGDIDMAWGTWVLEGPLIVDGMGIIVPTGFLTDFASIPRLLRWLYSPVGAPYHVAAVAHDYLYSSVPNVTRKEADRAYLSIAKAMGTKAWSARLMYRALRMGGYLAWRSNRKRLREDGPTWRMLTDEWPSWLAWANEL
jgi:hypothetical protein